MKKESFRQRLVSFMMSTVLVIGMWPTTALAEAVDAIDGDEVVVSALEKEVEEASDDENALNSETDEVETSAEAPTTDVSETEEDEVVVDESEEDSEVSDESEENLDKEQQVTDEPETVVASDGATEGEPADTNSSAELPVTPDEPTMEACGASLSWSYDAETRSLVVSGNGSMDDYESVLVGEERPWENLSASTVIVDEGVTCIGRYAFYGMGVSSISIPASVTSIGEGAIPSAATVRGYSGSFAEEYAVQNGMTFESVGNLEIDIATCAVTLEQMEYEYTGSAIKPKVTLVYAGSELVPGQDYGYRYENNTLPGQASVTITAKAGSKYVGSVTASFTILPLKNEIAFEKESVSFSASATAAKTIDLKAVATGGKLTFSTNNTKVKVSGEGLVTVPAGFTGKVTVTAKAFDEDGIYAECSKSMTIQAKKIANKITTKANSFTKTASASAQTFDLGTRRNGSGKISYKSSSSSVKVASNGKVTIAKNFVGKATITITVNSQGIYDKATKQVTLTVNPAKVAISKVSNSGANQATATWKKTIGAGGYEIQYSLKKDFSTAAKVKVSSPSTVTKAIGSLAKGKTYYVRVRAYKTVSGTTYNGAWSPVKSVAIKNGKDITLKGDSKITSNTLVAGKDARLLKFSAVSGATGYQVYYQIEKGSSVSAWKLAGSTASKSMTVNVKHGKTTFYSFKVRAYKKMADGSIIYSKFSTPTSGNALYYEPSFSVLMNSNTDRSTSAVAMAITNKGDFPLRVYAKNARLIENDYSRYDRNLKLVDPVAFDRGTLKYTSYVDVPAGTTQILGFCVDSDEATWYDQKSKLRFTIGYDGGEYTVYASSYYGTHYYE